MEVGVDGAVESSVGFSDAASCEIMIGADRKFHVVWVCQNAGKI